MYTVKDTTIEVDFIVPSLPKEALFKLPKYCKPTKYNLATQYYHWNRDLIKQNQKLQKEKQQLQEKVQEMEKRLTETEKEKEDLKLEKDKLLRMIFKPRREKQTIVVKPEPKPRTRQSYIRPLPKVIDEKREAILKQCPHCHSRLSKRAGYYQRIIEDIPQPAELKSKVIQYTINRYYCKHCQKLVSAKPLAVLPHSRLGINTLLYVLYAKYRSRLSQELIRENLETFFSLKLSKGAVNNLLSKGQEAFKDKWQEIIERVKHSEAVNADETRWGLHWLWAFVTDKAVRYTISEFRGKGVPQEVLGKNYNGVVGCDFYPAYNQFKRKQRCWVHLLRKARELVQQNPTKQRKQINQKLNRIYKEILFFKSKTAATKGQRTKKAEQIKKKLLSLSRQKTGDRNLQKVLNLCGKYAGELVVCVGNPNVSPDNNKAERAIRPAVVMRKISGSSRSSKGALTHEVNMSVIETLRKQEKQLFPAMKELVLGYLASNA